MANDLKGWLLLQFHIAERVVEIQWDLLASISRRTNLHPVRRTNVCFIYIVLQQEYMSHSLIVIIGPLGAETQIDHLLPLAQLIGRSDD